MKISYNWLQEHIKEKLPAPNDLAEQIIFHAFEVEEIEEREGDTIMEIKVLPDRAGDCLSHEGIAREVAGLLGFTLERRATVPLPEISATVPVQLQSDLCRRYIAVRIDNIKVGPSPEWLKEKLEAIGQRSINNIVDVTNFVLFDMGQPIHAFDASKIDGGVVVRLAHDTEGIKLLGGEEKILKETDLVIADYLGAVAIAGVKGGAAAEVTEQTSSIIIEVANFDPTSVRKTSRRLGLITDASKRFENNFSPEFASSAARQAVALILQIAGGTVSAITDEYDKKATARTITFSVTDITKLLGGSITSQHISEVCNRYGYTYKLKDSVFTLEIPHYRADITGVHDIAEEVGRVIGYDRIPAAPLPFVPAAVVNETDKHIAGVHAWAIQNGYREVYTYSLRPKGEVAIAYGAKGKDKLRSNLSDGLKESYEFNRLNAPLLGLEEVKLFEVGTVFFADREEVHVALCDKGTIQELSLLDFIKEKNIDNEALLDITSVFSHPIVPFKLWSPYPFVVRDIALWVSESSRKVAEKAIVTFAQKHCAVPAQLFDEFSKEGRTSIAYRFVFQAADQTLTDDAVTALIETLIAELAAIPGTQIR